MDPKRLGIDGGSAGGYTTLAALAFTDVFTGGCSYYGVASLEALAGDTHKFESRYLDYLVGPYPEMKQVYKDRAPIENLDKLSAPLMLFQGLEDKIVPPNQVRLFFSFSFPKCQSLALLTFTSLILCLCVPFHQAQMMFDVCLEKKIPVALEMFEGEQVSARVSLFLSISLD